MIKEIGSPSFAAVRGVEPVLVIDQLQEKASNVGMMILRMQCVVTFAGEMMMPFRKSTCLQVSIRPDEKRTDAVCPAP